MERSRRNFLRTASGSALAAAAGLPSREKVFAGQNGPFSGKLCFFSKHLSGAGWSELGRLVRQMGFEGVDLTVRRGGHVLPENAVRDLPGAVSSIREQGLEVPMITTELVSADHPTAHPILSTASKLSIPFYKPGYYRYSFVDARKERDNACAEFRGLAELGKQNGMQAGFHNHAAYIGGAVWDIASTIDGLDPKWVGYYFDIRHAVAEGGAGAWKAALSLVSSRLKMIAIKDFFWEKSGSRGWQQRNCPLGEGMVDWKHFFKTLAQSGFQGPVSLHLEYEISGSTEAAQRDNTLVAAQRDLEFLRSKIREAYV